MASKLLTLGLKHISFLHESSDPRTFSVFWGFSFSDLIDLVGLRPFCYLDLIDSQASSHACAPAVAVQQSVEKGVPAFLNDLKIMLNAHNSRQIMHDCVSTKRRTFVASSRLMN